jgi:hypothetical protein
MRVVVILAGGLLGLVGLFVAVIYWVIIGFSCNGTDAGDPPTPGSSAAELCDSPAFDGVQLALGLAAFVVPIVGSVVAARRRRYTPLLGSIAAAAGALSGLGVLLLGVGSATVELFVGLPLLACVGVGAVTVRQSRAERRQ